MEGILHRGEGENWDGLDFLSSHGPMLGKHWKPGDGSQGQVGQGMCVDGWEVTTVP